MPPARPRRRWWRPVLDLLLLPLAIVVVILEDVIWAGMRRILRVAGRLAGMRTLETKLARLPGWAAVPLFLVPEAFGRVGELWAAVLLFHKHVLAAAIVYVLVRLVATLMAVFIYHACEPALLRIRWFAAMVGGVKWVRDWALRRIAPVRERIRAFRRFAPGYIARRFRALHRKLSNRASLRL